jgi:chloramphenicol-sensitive protein RarD
MTAITANGAPARETKVGIAFGLAAFGWWGLIPIYFKAVAHVSALEVLAHRCLWSLLLLGALLVWQGKAANLLAPLRVPRQLLGLLAATTLIATNWGVYIWAVGHGHVVESSLGYFINPLVNVLLALAFLGERLRRLQIASVLLAALGVTWHVVALGELPLIGLTLASSFGLYGLIHKKLGLAGAPALFLEVLLLSPLAALYLVHRGFGGELAFAGVSRGTDLLLAAAGVVTALPLVWFIEATRRLTYVTIGFLQYVGPSLQLALGVLLYGEAFGPDLVITFALIWLALALFSYDSIRTARAG